MQVFKTRTRVRYAETDATGIVYYANYFIYFEVGRVEMFRELDLPYDRHLPIVETSCRYHASAEFEDELEIETFIAELRTRSFRIGQRVLRLREGAEPELLVQGHTVMVLVDENVQPIPLTREFRQAFERIAQGAAQE